MGMDPSMGMSAISSQAMAQSVQGSMSTTAAGATGEITFNGTISDLKEKYPEAYQKLVLEQLAYRIVEEVKRDNERFVETIKKNQR